MKVSVIGFLLMLVADTNVACGAKALRAKQDAARKLSSMIAPNFDPCYNFTGVDLCASESCPQHSVCYETCMPESPTECRCEPEYHWNMNGTACIPWSGIGTPYILQANDPIFQPMNITCDDVPGICGSGGTCQSDGSALYCSCYEGYDIQSNDISCSDVNECLSGSQECHSANSVCVNTPGGYEYVNLPATYPSSMSQVEIAFRNDDAGSPNITLFYGGKKVWDDSCSEFECEIVGSFSGVGFDCKKFQLSLENENGGLTGSFGVPSVLNVTFNGEVMVSDTTMPTGPSTQTVEPGLYDFTCGDVSCENVGEICGTGGTCQKTDDSIYCKCDSGYRRNGVSCHDIDECVERSHNCDPDLSVCVNTEGSFNCVSLPDGYPNKRSRVTVTFINDSLGSEPSLCLLYGDNEFWNATCSGNLCTVEDTVIGLGWACHEFSLILKNFGYQSGVFSSPSYLKVAFNGLTVIEEGTDPDRKGLQNKMLKYVTAAQYNFTCDLALTDEE